jgi:hypothetical protein
MLAKILLGRILYIRKNLLKSSMGLPNLWKATKLVPGAPLRMVALSLTGWQVPGDQCQPEREAKGGSSKQAVSKN